MQKGRVEKTERVMYNICIIRLVMIVQINRCIDRAVCIKHIHPHTIFACCSALLLVKLLQFFFRLVLLHWRKPTDLNAILSLTNKSQKYQNSYQLVFTHASERHTVRDARQTNL